MAEDARTQPPVADRQEAEERRARLAAAMRSNLRRRKEQQRARGLAPAPAEQPVEEG